LAAAEPGMDWPDPKYPIVSAQAKVILFAALFLEIALPSHAADSGLQPGATAPAFTLKNQVGQAQTLQSLAGPNGLHVLFSRSADWCGLCKSQLTDLEASREVFEAKGIHIASVTYDSPAILKAFSTRRAIHFTLLSDPDSATIKAFGVLNPDATGSQAGIAIPNYFFIGPDGKIRNRFPEGLPQQRATSSYLFESIFGSGTARPFTASVVPATPHLTVKISQADLSVAPGSRTRLTVNLVPEAGEHLYASGAETFGYRPIRLTLDPSDLYQSDAAAYGQSTILEFANLKEKVPVFESATQISDDVWALGEAKNNALFTENSELKIHGTLEYQVCTKNSCFAPENKPVSWTLHVLPGNFDRVCVAEDLQRK
jgi:peroxiredoxin